VLARDAKPTAAKRGGVRIAMPSSCLHMSCRSEREAPLRGRRLGLPVLRLHYKLFRRV
jgi:hypothetical protein